MIVMGISGLSNNQKERDRKRCHGVGVFAWIIGTFFSVLMIPLSAQTWQRHLEGIGTFSSPRVADLNGDGVSDVIFGAGREEFVASDSAIVALNGKSGEVMWTASARDQIFGSACLTDLTDDGIMDVLINGRSAELQAINGATGEVLWQFFVPQKGQTAREAGWYNFYNPQLIPDQNRDGYPDILISNGGDVLVEPYDPDRPVGHLMIINSRTGELIAKAPMPDGGETYMSVSVRPGKKATGQILFGTGGETIGGHLYTATIKDVLKGDLSTAFELASSEKKGFIAPGVWVDITEDGTEDIVVSAVDGRVLAFDGKDFDPLWTTEMPNTEAYSSLTVGQFTEDDIPDFFTSVVQGVWPKLEWNRQFMINGATGTIEFQDSLGFYQTSSAVSADLTGNGKDEVLMSLNYQVINEFQQKFFYNLPIIIKFDDGQVIKMMEPFEGNNISSTPWIGDLDNNGKLDILYLHATNLRHTYTFDGMKVHRFSTDVRIKPKQITWGAYMGGKYDGVFSEK